MANKMQSITERTYIMVKPDGVDRGLISDIMKRFEQRGYKLIALKMLKVIVSFVFIFTSLTQYVPRMRPFY